MAKAKSKTLRRRCRHCSDPGLVYVHGQVTRCTFCDGTGYRRVPRMSL